MLSFLSPLILISTYRTGRSTIKRILQPAPNAQVNIPSGDRYHGSGFSLSLFNCIGRHNIDRQRPKFRATTGVRKAIVGAMRSGFSRLQAPRMRYGRSAKSSLAFSAEMGSSLVGGMAGQVHAMAASTLAREGVWRDPSRSDGHAVSVHIQRIAGGIGQSRALAKARNNSTSSANTF